MKYNRIINGGTLAIAVSILLLLVSCGKRPSASMELNVVSYGAGAYQESHRKAFIEPFAKSSSIPVNSLNWNADYGKLKAMVESGKVPWDVVEVTEGQYQRGHREKLFSEILNPPPSSDFMPGMIHSDGVANVYWGTALAFKKDKFPTKKPVSWKDFWDIESFPGPRGLYDDPRATLEFALLADGVEIDKLYPLDVDRAFKMLDKIKSSVRVWWSDGAQSVQILLSDSVVMSPAWTGRIYANKDAAAALEYSWDGGALELDYWVVPKGSTNQKAASDFIRFASGGEKMAEQCQIVGYGPTNIKALETISKLSPEAAKVFPTHPDNFRRAFIVNGEWWSNNELAVKERWLKWKNQ